MNVKLLFNLVSWLAVLAAIAMGCYYVSWGVASLVVHVLPTLEGIFQIAVIAGSIILTVVIGSVIVLIAGSKP